MGKIPEGLSFEQLLLIQKEVHQRIEANQLRGNNVLNNGINNMMGGAYYARSGNPRPPKDPNIIDADFEEVSAPKLIAKE